MKRQIFRHWTACALAAWVLSGCGGSGTATLSSASLESTLAAGSSELVTPMYNAIEATNAPPWAAVSPLSADQISPDGGGNGGVTKVYTPGQIRAAYRMPALPSDWSNLSATQAADMGAGQTIYIITAYHTPNIEGELQAFNTQFGLPQCSSLSIASTDVLPIAAANGNACRFAKVYASANNSMADAPPVYDASWAREAALDVQWAHATAPLARIILIESIDATITHMLSAINLANAMGPGVLSMSFGTPEGNWVTDQDSAFGAANMSYLAASGDSGAGVAQWPAVSTRVLGVGGTTLAGYSPSSRSETVWPSAGGGRSAWVSAPAYQNASVPGLGAQTFRSVADVAFNADPYTGQYVAIIAPNTNTVTWYSMGGTSLGTPQWAGLVAVARAHRARLGQSTLTDVNTPLYQAASSGVFYGLNSTFIDITNGNSNGIFASAGYDIPTGLGTPNVNGLITLLAPDIGGPGGTAPVLTPKTVTGTVGTPLTFSLTYTAAHAVSWSIAGAPSGMTIDAGTGVVTWTAPVAGDFSVTVTAKDNINQQSGATTVPISIALASGGPLTPPTLTSQGNAGIPLAISLPSVRRKPLTYTLNSVLLPGGGNSAPSDLTLNSSGWIQ